MLFRSRQYVAEHLKLARLLHEKRDADDATVSFEASDAAAESFVELVKAKFYIGKRPHISIVVNAPDSGNEKS